MTQASRLQWLASTSKNQHNCQPFFLFSLPIFSTPKMTSFYGRGKKKEKRAYSRTGATGWIHRQVERPGVAGQGLDLWPNLRPVGAVLHLLLEHMQLWSIRLDHKWGPTTSTSFHNPTFFLFFTSLRSPTKIMHMDPTTNILFCCRLLFCVFVWIIVDYLWWYFL